MDIFIKPIGGNDTVIYSDWSEVLDHFSAPDYEIEYAIAVYDDGQVSRYTPEQVRCLCDETAANIADDARGEHAERSAYMQGRL